MPTRAVLFDLDGTLLDTLRDVGEAANAALRACGFPPHPIDDYRRLLGGGVRNLFAKALPADAATAETIDRCIEEFREIYRAGWNVHTRPYAGIPELIAELSRREVRLAVLSNKPHEYTSDCIEEYFGSAAAHPPVIVKTPLPGRHAIGPFAIVFGQRTGVPLKPDPTAACEIARFLDVAPSECLYVGDTSIDMETARRAAMRPIGVSWGFRDREELIAAGAELVIDSPRELLSLL